MRRKSISDCGSFGKLVTLAAFALLFQLIAVPAFAGATAKPAVSISPKRIGPGDLAVITVTNTSCDIDGTFLKMNLHFNKAKSGCKAIVGIDLNTEPGTYTLKLSIGEKKLSRDVKVSKKKYPLQRLTLRDDLVTLSPENEARAEREQKLVTALWPVDSPKVWNGRFIDPLPGHEIGTPFGVRRIINDIPKNSHSGVDVSADEGEPVKAPNEGVVVLIGEHFFSGKCVFLDHGQGVYTMFFHLSKINVRYGQAVLKGEAIAEVGSTGRATGAHLHWGARVQGAKVDPLQLMKLKVD